MLKGKGSQVKNRENKEIDAYKWFVIDLKENKAITGNEYKSDALDVLSDYDDKSRYKVVSEISLKTFGIENPKEKWKHQFADGGGVDDDSKFLNFKKQLIKYSDFNEKTGDGFSSRYVGLKNKKGDKSNGQYLIEGNQITWVYIDARGNEYISDEIPELIIDLIGKKESFDNGGGVGFRNIDKIKSHIGESVFNHINSLNKKELEKQLSELRNELKITDKESSRYYKLKDEEWFILYRLERSSEYKFADGGGVGEIKITKNEVQFREDEPNRVYHWYEGTLGKYVFYAQTDNSFKGIYGSDGINKGSVYKLSIRKVKENGMHESIAEYWNKWDYRTKNVKDGAIRSKIIKYLESISDERTGTAKKYENGGSIKNNNDYMRATDKYDYYGALLDDAREENNTTEMTKLIELMEKLETEINRYERNYADGGSVGEIEAKIADFRKRAENKAIPESAKNKFLSMAEELEKTLPKAEKKEEAKAEKPKFKVGDVVVLQGGDALLKKITSIKENKKGEIIYSGYYQSKPSEKFSMDGTELVIFKRPKYEPKEKEEKGESKKAEMSEKDCEDLLAKYKAEREARKERAEKREKQGKPAELTPAETTKKAVDRVTDKIEAKAEKGKSVKGDIKAVFSQFKSAVAELKKYKDEIDQNEVRSLIKELESLLTKKMATGGAVDSDMTEKEFLAKYFGSNVYAGNPSEYFDIKKLSSSNDSKVEAFISELKRDGYSIKKKSYSDFTSVMGVKKKMATGGGVGADAKKLSEEGQFELKVLQSVKGYNDGLTINGILENMGMSNYRFNEDASSSNMKKVKKSLESLIKKGFIEESGLGYEITREGANYLRTFSYGTY
jgi:hypothetical protein